MGHQHFLSVMLRGGGPFALVNATTGATVAARLEPAFDSATRRRGLLGRDSLETDAALVIAPCGAVHTFFMRFAIDVVFVRGDGSVVKVCRDVRPWRAAGAAGAFAAIEFAAGAADRARISPGDRFIVEPRVCS